MENHSNENVRALSLELFHFHPNPAYETNWTRIGHFAPLCNIQIVLLPKIGKMKKYNILSLIV